MFNKFRPLTGALRELPVNGGSVTRYKTLPGRGLVKQPAQGRWQAG